MRNKFIKDYNIEIKNHLETTSCLCGSKKNQTVFEYDRYGLFSPTVICNDCGLLFTNPRPNLEYLNKFYSQGMYRAFYESVKYSSQPIKKLSLSELSESFSEDYESSDFIFNHTKNYINNEDLVLEIGMGGGWNLIPFENKNRLYGTDLDKDLCELATIKGINNVICGDIDDINFGKKFKLIILNHVIEHLHNISDYLIKIRSLLCADGYLYVGCPSYNHIHNYGEIQNVHLYYFTKNNLINILSKNNFKIDNFGFEDKINQFGIFYKSENNDYKFDKKEEFNLVIGHINNFKKQQLSKYKFRILIKKILGHKISKIIKNILQYYRAKKTNLQIFLFGVNSLKPKKFKEK